MPEEVGGQTPSLRGRHGGGSIRRPSGGGRGGIRPGLGGVTRSYNYNIVHTAIYSNIEQMVAAGPVSSASRGPVRR